MSRRFSGITMDYPCLFGGLPMIHHVGCLFGGLRITNVCLAEGKRRFLGNSCSPFRETTIFVGLNPPNPADNTWMAFDHDSMDTAEHFDLLLLVIQPMESHYVLLGKSCVFIHSDIR